MCVTHSALWEQRARVFCATEVLRPPRFPTGRPHLQMSRRSPREYRSQPTPRAITPHLEPQVSASSVAAPPSAITARRAFTESRRAA